MLTDDVFYGISAGCGLFGRSLGENFRLSVPQGHGHLSALATEEQVWLTLITASKGMPNPASSHIPVKSASASSGRQYPMCCMPNGTSAFEISHSVIRHEVCSRKRTSTLPVRFRFSSRCMMRNLEESFGFWWMSKTLEATLSIPVLHVRSFRLVFARRRGVGIDC